MKSAIVGALAVMALLVVPANAKSLFDSLNETAPKSFWDGLNEASPVMAPEKDVVGE